MSENKDNLAEIKILQDAWIKIWQMYMTWFTWHFGINVVGLGWALSRDLKSNDLRLQAGTGALLMVFFATLTIFVALKMRGFHIATAERARSLELGVHHSLIFGEPLARYACFATLVANIAILIAWVFAFGWIRWLAA